MTKFRSGEIISSTSVDPGNPILTAHWPDLHFLLVTYTPTLLGNNNSTLGAQISISTYILYFKKNLNLQKFNKFNLKN